ncbi:uncharacterized protein BJ171DRAFT_98478 [Polychytrium aggregatum]|uniref:uncharacterized protein n=1 Tax=Polychytrium aggregatum TaxID=110093 RepID=UPI0022FE650F|nr:uncharacterized protein BJ171DRAFT_98478 [Polychytrium aggregatum]KAI9204600.1 hypothetical protein BJ171DRAFT_98478 [Polychytrium aggregatum]
MSGCVDLQNTYYCPEFAGNFVRANSTQDVDNNIAQLIGGSWQGSVQSQLSCPNFNETTVRYRLAVVCGIYADVYTNSDPNSGVNCPENAQKSAGTRQLCSSALQAYMSTLAVQYNTCDPNNGVDLRNQDWGTLTHLQSDLPATDSANCVSTMALERALGAGCGFHTSDAFHAYCASNSTDSCCTTDAANATSATSALPSTTSSISIVPRISPDAPTTRSAPVPVTTQTPDSSNNGPNIPLIAGGAAGGLVLLVALVLGFVLVRRRKARQVEEQYPHNPDNSDGYGATQTFYGGPATTYGAATTYGGASYSGQTNAAVYNYIPNLSDEIAIESGDVIVIKETYDDGWAFGYNTRTKSEGCFPLACVEPNTAGGPSEGAPQTKQIKQRGSSLYTRYVPK